MTTFQGRFENAFKPSYMRNHKAVTTKNLRCFPVCGEEHRDNGFCGNEVVVSWVAEGPQPPGELETYAEFQEAEEAPRFKVGQLVSDLELTDEADRSREDRNKKNLMKGETKEGKDPLHGSLHFARESKGWHYGWMAGRGNGSHALHEMRVYLFERVSMDKSICRLVMHSPPFVVTSRKRLRGKKVNKEEVEEDGEDDGARKKAKRTMPPVTGASPAKHPITFNLKSDHAVLPPLPSLTNSSRQHSVPPFSMPMSMPEPVRVESNSSSSHGNHSSSAHIQFAQPPARRVPGFVHFGNIQQHHQQSHGPTPPSYLPTPPSLSSQIPVPPFGARMSNAPQWPFSSTPPIYAHSSTPPMYTHPSTTPPIYNLPFSTFGSDFPNFNSQPQISDSEVLDSILGPTPPSSFSNMLSMRPSAHPPVFLHNRASGDT